MGSYCYTILDHETTEEVVRPGQKNVIFVADEDDLKWFNEHLPIHGAKQWFFNACLKRLRAMHEAGQIESPLDLVGLTVREIGRREL